MSIFLITKYVHIISATILFGTGIGSAFLLFFVNRRGLIGEITFATRYVVMADWVFTTPSAIIQLVSGLMLLYQSGYPFSTSWVVLSLVLYVFIGACWLPVVWIQIKMRDYAQLAKDKNHMLPAIYWRLDRWWIGLGICAFIAMGIIFYLMVFKPQF